jgi:hypothetical protein
VGQPRDGVPLGTTRLTQAQPRHVDVGAVEITADDVRRQVTGDRQLDVGQSTRLTRLGVPNSGPDPLEAVNAATQAHQLRRSCFWLESVG